MPHHCPACSHETAQKIRFTAWGGVIGPRLLSLVRCNGCGMQYNGKSGRRVEKAIRVYTSVALGVLILLAGLMIYAMLSQGAPVKKVVPHGEPAGFVS
jgi:hypothetical protein